MDRALLEQQTEAMRAAFARGAGCDVSAYESHELMVVDRPEPPAWPYVALVSSFGRGTVVSIEASYREFVEGLRAEPHHAAAAWPPYLESIVAEARRRGLQVTAGPVALIWALSAVPAESRVPEGLELRTVDREWMAAEQQSGRFENGVGEPGRNARAERNRFGKVLFDSSGEPAAVAGVFQTLGLQEIGVDVVPSAQGRALSPIVVAAAARAVLDEGGVPMYACTSTNTGSQRTALASGFLPVGTDVAVR